MKIFALILFFVTYALMIALQKARPWIALGSAAVFIVAGIVSLADILPSIDFNVLLMLAGTMGTVSLFIASGMPGRLAEILLRNAPNTMWVAVAMSLFAGIISAFIDNVATVLMIAPVGMAVAKKLKISPVPLIICIAVSSNLQGAATLVGTPPASCWAATPVWTFWTSSSWTDAPASFLPWSWGPWSPSPSSCSFSGMTGRRWRQWGRRRSGIIFCPPACQYRPAHRRVLHPK